MCDASRHGDRDTIDQLLDESYILVYEGKSHTKAEYLSRLKPEDSIQSFSFEGVNLELDGEVAVLTGTLITQVKKLYIPFKVKLKFTDKLIKRDGQWRFISSQLSRL
jgi:hypothetical protein